MWVAPGLITAFATCLQTPRVTGNGFPFARTVRGIHQDIKMQATNNNNISHG